jgi:hypothetical protein
MAKGTKDPCISHVDASHAEWPRIKSFLLFCNFFILSKSLRKAYFLRVKLGSLERKLPRLGIDIFWIFWHLRHFRAMSLWKKQGPFRPWSFWWGLREDFWGISTLLHLPPLRFHCVGGCLDRNQDSYVFGILEVNCVSGIRTRAARPRDGLSYHLVKQPKQAFVLLLDYRGRKHIFFPKAPYGGKIPIGTWACRYYRGLCCTWIFLYHRGLCCTHGRVYCLHTTGARAEPGLLWTKGAWADPGRVYNTEALAAPWRVYIKGASAAPVLLLDLYTIQRPVLHLDVSTKQGPDLHVSGQLEP